MLRKVALYRISQELCIKKRDQRFRMLNDFEGKEKYSAVVLKVIREVAVDGRKRCY